MKIRRRKSTKYAVWRGRKTRVHYKLKDLLDGMEPIEQDDEDREWLNMAPVGHEFGSPDFERLEQEMSDRIMDPRKLRRATRKLMKSTSQAKRSISASLMELKGILRKPSQRVSVEDMNIERKFEILERIRRLKEIVPVRSGFEPSIVSIQKDPEIQDKARMLTRCELDDLRKSKVQIHDRFLKIIDEAGFNED